MKSDWKKVKLGEITTLSQGIQVPTESQSLVLKDGYVRFVRIVDYTNDNEIPRYIKNPGHQYLVEGDDLVMIRYGSQTAGKIVRGIKGAIANNTFQVKVQPVVDKNFLYWFLSQNSIYQDLNKSNSSSTMPAITFEQVKNIELSLPPLPIQQSIANVLSSLDDKIENLQKQNQVLENIAQTLFKRWFVDFEFPDENGNPYKSSCGKMVASELGLIPEGWRVGKLGEEFDISIGRTPPRMELEWFSKQSENTKKWISIKDIGNCGVYIFNTSEYLTNDAIQRFNIPIIPENTTILSFKMTVGKLTITSEEMLSNEAIAHIKLKVDSVLSSEFIYLYLQNLDFNSLGSTSSIVTAINSTMIKLLEILIPDRVILELFDSAIPPLFKKIRENSKQIEFLVHSRDLLLPKLMRGEIEI